MCAPTTEDYTFYFLGDDQLEVLVNDVTLVGTRWDQFDELETSLTANTLFDFDLKWAEIFGYAKVISEWSSSMTSREEVPDTAFWSTQRINGVTNIVIAATSTPADSTLESSPTDDRIVVPNTATYTMQSRSASNTAQPTEDDVFTVKLTCSDAALCDCGDTEYTATATHMGDGLYYADLTPTVGGTYDVLITMENAYTAAESSASITVSDNLTLVVIDDTTVPSACTVVASATTGDIVRPTGSTFTYTLQCESSDADDVYTVTLTSITAEE